MNALFLISLALLVYTYAGYPILLYILSRVRAPDRNQQPLTSRHPAVTVIIAAFNEESSIAATIGNKLEADYPAEKLNVLVVSDGSTDETNRIVEDLAREHPDRLRLILQDPRQGKTAALNRAVEEATGEVLVFSDANSLYETNAVRRLVSRFDDSGVGYVTGKMVYTNADGTITGNGCTAYMRYENQLRLWESRLGSVVGVDGGIDAIRSHLYAPMRADQLPDFVLPLKVVVQGYRVVYEPGAILSEPALSDARDEYRMRVRVTLRALWALIDLRELLLPWKYPRFSWQLGSHKVLRYLAFAPQFGLLISNVVLVGHHSLYKWVLAAQGVFYLLAFLGFQPRKRGPRSLIFTAPYYLTLLNVACAQAFGKLVRGQKQVLWKPRTG